MNYKVTEIINAVLYSLEGEYDPHFFLWVEKDTERNRRWVEMTDRFEEALVKAMRETLVSLARREGEIYKSDMLSLIREYHNNTGKNETESFLRALEVAR